MQDFGYARDSAHAISLPLSSSGQQVAAFAIRSSDRSPVQLTCQLNGPAAAQPLPALEGFEVNIKYNCSSPQAFSITDAGSYEFSVFGTDSVGNWEQDPAVHAFTVAYQNGSMYTRISGPGWGASRNRSHVFMLTAIQGTPDGKGTMPVVSVPFQYSVSSLSQNDTQDAAWLDSPWAPVNGSTLTYTVY